MESIWTRDIKPAVFPKLMNDITADTLIVGGGMAGVLCAHELSLAGVDCVLLEADRIGRGITSGTTAVISAQHSVLYGDLIRRFGREAAKAYLEANLLAVKRLSEVAWGVDCDFEMRPSVLYSRTQEAKMRREAAAVKDLGFNARFTSELPLGIQCAGAVVFPDMAQFHPLKLLNALAEKLRIYEKSAVLKIKDGTASTESGSVTAKNIIIASHFPFIDRRGLYFMKLRQKRESVMAVENAPKLDCTLSEDAEKGFFFRTYQDKLIVGCGCHDPGHEEEDYARIRLFLKEHVPEAREVCRWVNQDCFTLDEVPYIGRYSPATPHLFVAAGFNAWGMTSSMAAAMLLRDAILGRENKYAGVFDPARAMPAGPLLENTAHSAASILLPTLPRCTHMGCALKHNDAEHTWDCPCHGSRFAEDGTVITGPAVKKASVN